MEDGRSFNSRTNICFLTVGNRVIGPHSYLLSWSPLWQPVSVKEFFSLILWTILEIRLSLIGTMLYLPWLNMMVNITSITTGALHHCPIMSPWRCGLLILCNMGKPPAPIPGAPSSCLFLTYCCQRFPFPYSKTHASSSAVQDKSWVNLSPGLLWID